MSAQVAAAFPADEPVLSRRALLPLLRELGDLKRVTSAGRRGSIAERLFRRAWGQLMDGASARDVALAVTARALAAARLGDLDEVSLAALGLTDEEAFAVQKAALAEFRSVLPAGLLEATTDALRSELGTDKRSAPAFVDALAGQPRAGVTCPGRPRIVLQPAENHAEHCLVVAVYAVLLAEDCADTGAAFLAALAHHLHNAAMPDAGFTGEMLLGPHLEPVMARATQASLAELPPELRAAIEDAREILPDASTPEGRAFHTGDVIDRVLEIEQHLAAARLTMDEVLGEMALVHDGPVKPFHDAVLVEMGLA